MAVGDWARRLSAAETFEPRQDTGGALRIVTLHALGFHVLGISSQQTKAQRRVIVNNRLEHGSAGVHQGVCVY